MKNPVFILGCPRTGSKIYMKILNDYSPINITPELHFLIPFWIRKDFVTTVKENIGDLKQDTNIPKLITLMYSGKLQGSFWKSIKNRNIDKKKLENKILKSDRSFEKILTILLEEHAILKHKETPGAKFPVHFSHISKLLKWYPNCKIIFLLRDPRAIYASNAIGSTKKSSSNIKSTIIRLKILIQTIIYFRWAVKIHKKHSHMKNYQLSRFEDIINKPEKHMPELCKFLEIEFKQEMLTPPVIDSSFHKNRKKGFDKETLNRWKTRISPITANIIKTITKKQIKSMEYN